MNRWKKAACLGAMALGLGGLVWYRLAYRMPLKEYTRRALYMAVLDDEICRRELAEAEPGGKPVRFPPRAESLQYRYHLFLGLNRAKSRKALQIETARMERRLASAPPLRPSPSATRL